MERRHSGSLSSLSGATPPGTPRTSTDGKPKGAGIQMQIQQLANEQERVQKKTFTNWMNSYLKQKNMKVENLFEDIKDGVYLLSLLEVLSGDKLKMEKGKLKRVHYVSNISTALNFLEQKKIKLVNINVSDIADGKPSIVLGLIWTIILYFQIEDTFAQNDDSGEQAPLSAIDKFRKNAKKALLAWTANAITKKYGIEVNNFGKSWRDGLAFNAMVHTINPDLVDFDQCRKQDARTNLEQAFSVAESQLGIARLLDPEDVDVEKPDEKSVMTYVAQFLKAYPEAGEDPSLSKRKNPAEQEISDYNDLLTWIKEEADELLQIVDQPVTDRQSEYMDYLAFKTEFDRRQKIYQRLEEKVVSKKAVKITPKMWQELEPKWRDIARRTRMWLWKLDASLPGRLGKFGDWLNQAEEMLEIEPENQEDHIEMADQLLKLLNEHKDFFKEMDPYKEFFLQVKRAGKYEGEFIPPPQMDNLHTRLQVVCKEAPKRENLLQYDEFRFRLAGFSAATEEKLKIWLSKLGTQEDVEEMALDYKDFVQTKNLFANYDKMLSETKKRGDAFRKHVSKEEAAQINQFADEETQKWKTMSAEIKSLQSMFDEGLEQWKRYNGCYDMVIAWITEGEQVMHGGTKEQIEEYFTEIPQYEERLKFLNESANFLIENCQEPIAEEIKQNVNMINGRFTELVEGYQQYKKVEVIGKGRQEYQLGVDRISEWLQNAEELLATEVPCKHAALKDHLQDVDMCGNQVAEMEADFKVTTKTAQSLVKDSEQTMVNEMLQTLNVQKEVIVRLRKEIPERIKYLKAVLPNVESLETGILDLNAWLVKGEALLATHKLDGDHRAVEERLEKHKQFFSETTYQKSIVESKNKVHQKVTSTKPKLKNVNFDDVDIPMEETNTRFQSLISAAKDWEKKLDNLSRLWKVYSQKEQALASWLQQAQTVLNDNEDDSDSLIRKHKGFFNKIDKRLLDDYLRAGQDILMVLDDRDKSELQQDMASMQETWKNVQASAPIKLVKLEFRLPEEIFIEQVDDAEKTLQQEQKQLQRNENVKQTLQKHRQMFNQGPFVPTCTRCLEDMESFTKNLHQLDRNDHNLQDRYDHHLDRWRKLNGAMENIHLQLKQLPERWKEYNQKMNEFKKAVQTVDDLTKALQREDLTSEEYKDLENKYQKALRDMHKLAEDGQWLEENLEELLKDSPEADADEERRKLRDLMGQFVSIQPGMESLTDKSAVFSKAYDFRDELQQRSNWLDEAQRQVNDDPFIDGLEDARAFLGEHESMLKKLDTEGARIQADIDAGRRLQKDRNAPAFVSKTVEELDRKLKDTNEKAKQKHEKLKQKVKEWENYEKSKSDCIQLLKKAEAELEKPPATSGQELAEKDLQSKRELQRTLDKLKGSINDMQQLNAVLAESASRERKGPLKVEISEIDKRLDNVSNRLNAKLADLEATIAKWTEYYKRLNNFCEWLNTKESNLNDVFENKSAQPEEQLDKANDISREVYENRVTLDNLDKDARGLSQNFRSRETSALKTKLASVRRQWENLCSRAKDRSSALTGSVAHWQMYQNLSQQLLPWMEKAQRYCATELPKCSSLEEAKDLYNLHQSFVKECEEQLPIFEKLNTEAGYLMDQPNVPREMEDLQRRWNDIISSSEDRSHKAEKMYGAWAAYDQEISNFDEVLDKLQGRLGEEPNLHSTDVQVLEHELAIGKTLQEEIKSHQPHLRALEKQFEQVKKHASPEGVQALQSKMDAVKMAYNKTSEDAAERQNMVGAAVRHRQDFYGQLQDFEKWLKKSQRKLDTGNEIYADEVPDLQAKLKELRAECEGHEPMFNALTQEFKDLIQNCSEEEAAMLRDRFDRMMAGYSKVEDLIKNREDLCEQWVNYSGDQKDVQAKLKSLQQKLQQPDISEEEVNKINKEVEALRKSMAPWNRKKDQLDDLMGTAQLVIKDRATQRTLHFGTELQALENMCDSVSTNASQKQGHLSELHQLWDEFDNKKGNLLGKLQTLGDKIQNSTVDSSSLQGIKELVNEIEEARDDMYAMNPEYEQLRELGRQLQQADTTKGGTATESLRQVNKAWDHIQALLSDKHQTYTGVANLWQQYNDNKQNVGRVLDDVQPQVQQEMAFTSPDEVKKALDQHKNAEFELHANQSQLDQMNNKGLQLLEELKNCPNFDVSVLERDLDEVNHKWETSNSEIEQHKENLEAQLICWDQVNSGKEEIESWMNTMNTKLADSLTHFDDAVSVESCLMKYKEEAPYYADVISEVQQKIADLQELNKGRPIPELSNSQEEIQEKFDKSSTMANQLEAIMANFSDERTNLQRAIEQETDAINRIKDKLAKCDDVSGSDEDLVRRLQTTKELQKELEEHEKNIKALQDKTAALQNKYPSAETSNLAKDAVVLGKKFDTVVNRGDKIADTLESTLEQHCQDAQLQEQRWLNAAKEKLSWCGDISGDRYSVEGKLATIKDLIAGLKDGEQKKNLAAAKLDSLKAVLPRERQAELERQRKQADKEFQDLVKQLQQTQNKLEGSVDQWTEYDNKYEGLSQWIKDMEGKVRNEGNLKSDLPGKTQQAEHFSDLNEDIQRHRPQFEALRNEASEISNTTGDGRTATYATQLLSRYETLANNVNEQCERCDQNAEQHQDYLNKHKHCTDWLEGALQQLEDCSDLADDQDSLQAKLQNVEDILADKEEGLAKFNAALEAGEKLYPNTSNTGREAVRKDLRALREKWESFNDKLNDTQRSLESSRMQWTTFDDNYDQLLNWVADMDNQVQQDEELRNTLQEKKAMLQHYRTRCQDILSHQTMIDSVGDKGAKLSSQQAKGKLKKLNDEYRALCTAAQNQVKTAEEHVDQHQLYHDAHQQCRDWMTSTKDKLTVCAEVTGDKQALNNRLDRVQDLMTSLRDGEKKVKATHVQGEKTLPQTARQGQAHINGELESVTQDYETLATRLGETQQNLTHSIQALQAYDGSCESLNRWLRDVEAQIKDLELKSTLPEKQAQVEKYKALQNDVHTRQGQFDDLKNMASQVQGSDSRLISLSSQLSTRYQTAKTNLNDLIGKLRNHALEHETYQENFSECSEWLGTLLQRLQVCADMAGDKHDVEDRLSKLQELVAEKDQGATRIHYTVECGEKLYPSTASEGRDIIRQELRGLREHWEQGCDVLSETQRKLDTTLLQWSSYDENFEQFQKWLLDTEIKLREDTDLKATLPDKKAQLQNHRVLHQDIVSRQHVMDNLLDKARNLSQSTPSAKVAKFVGELQTKYEKLCDTSKQMLDKLEASQKDHQQYQDMYQDCQDWLNSSREKVELCADTSGDKMSLQNKLERLKECAEKVEDGEKKLKATKELCEKTTKNSSQRGREVLRRDIDHLQSEWEDYLARIQQTEEDLQTAMVQWGDFESKFSVCSSWLKDMEQQVKNYELKSTLKEKQTQVERFKKQREEILSHQPEIDRFTDDAQNLMHTSADARLSTQVSQLTNRYRGLLSQVKELISKWEKYAQDHQGYDNRLAEFNNWIEQADTKLDNCQQSAADQETMEERRTTIQMLMAEKDHGLQRLNATIEAGEKLYPDTAAGGREKVRQELRTAKEDWDRLFTGLSDTQRKVDSFLMQWSSYADGQDQLMKWMVDTEAALRADVDLKNTLQEKRLQLQNLRPVLSDITSHQRLVDSVIEKAQGVLHSTSNPEVAAFITDINSRYEDLCQTAKNTIQQCERNVYDHQQYHDSLQAAVDWMTLMKDRVGMCADISGDRHTLQNKFDRVQELLAQIPDNVNKISVVEEKGAKAMDTTALKGRQGIQQELDMLKMDWENYTTQVRSLHDNLDRAIEHWIKYEEQHEKISHWVKDMEKKVKDFPLKSTVEDKQHQLVRYQELMQDLRSHQREVDQFSDDGQTLQQLTGESRVATSISQLVSRYQTLQQTVKENLKKCEQNVADHKLYRDRHTDCSQWLTKARKKFGQSADTSGNRNDLEDRLEKIQELSVERDTGFGKLNNVIESGERLYPNTAAEGREVVRQELRQLKLGWESLFDDLSAAQRKLEVALVQWTSFDDSYGQVEHWLRDMESQLEGQLPLRSTLEEKKTQLQNYKVLHQDVLSYQRVIESVNDKAQSLVQSSSDPHLTKFVTQARTRYQKLCTSAKERVQQYEVFVADHQQYNDAYNNCIEWLNGIREKLSMCSDVSGDRHTIQNRLDKIQDIVATKMEGEPKVKNCISLAERVLPSTAPQGKDIIIRETDALRDDWDAFVNALQKTKTDLENCMGQWKEFDAWQEKVSAWLKDLEAKVREIELKATLKDKQVQIDRLKAIHRELLDHQGDIDALSDAAQDLVRVSTDTRVISQASQLSTKYQTVYVNVKELCRRWEQYVLDHQAYNESFNQCKSWLQEMRNKLQAHTDISGDRKAVQERLSEVQELTSDKDEGLHMLQIALDNLQIVLPNTSVPGRDNLRREMQGLQAEYDALSGDLNELKTKLDGTLAQWTVYDDSIEQLHRWLNDLELQLQTESQLQNTLQEKKLQFERVKVLQLNINSQQSTIDNLNDKAENLKQTSKDTNLGNQIRQLVTKYEKLLNKVKDLMALTEKNVKDHQIYRDTFMDCSEWLSSMVDRLNLCSDVRGDRTAIEAQIQKLQELNGNIENGKDKLNATIGKGEIVLPETSNQGQELIKEELSMLTSEFEGFVADGDDLRNNLERLMEEWHLYENQYDELSQWIKDTETDMKEESDLKATLEDKTEQLEKQQGTHEAILDKQNTFDALAERAQTLLQSTTDNRVTSQLTQLSARYTTLMSASKDLLKRYEQHVMDHEQYAESFTEAATWLQNTRDKLSVCSDTSGDKYTIQSQLEKLQEFVIAKDEGQLMIHSANTWGEKAMTNTSMEGREMIRKELQQLQQEWESLISEITDTKVMLESCLLQWADYNHSYDKIQKWLRDMEKRLRETEPKADLSEKKAELQRLKGVYQDVISYEQMIESIDNKAQELSSKSPHSKASTDTTQIVSKYQTLKNQAKDSLARSEQCVASHQSYHDSCNGFISWLRAAREKLATCQDTFGEKTAVVSKIDRLKALQADVGEGSHRQTEATKSGELTLHTTSPSGQTKIRHELQAMKRDFDEYRTMLNEALEDQDTSLSKWNEFEESYNQFNAWLKEAEGFLRADLEPKITLEEKKKQWDHYLNYMEEVMSHQSTMDRVNEKAQALLATNADAKTSHAITQLTTRYQGVVAMSKDIVKNLELHCDNHAAYKQANNDFEEWLGDTKHKLGSVHDSSGTKDDVGSKLNQIMELQAAMDQGHNLLRTLLECSERTLPNTNPRGCQIIKQETERAKTQYENLLTDVSQAKRGLESALSQWGDFDRSYDQLLGWIMDLETKLRSDPEARVDLPEKRSSLEKFKAIQADILAHRDALNKLEDKASHLKDSRPIALVRELNSRYQQLHDSAKDMTVRLDDIVRGHEEYRKSYIGCLDWLANNRHRLQRLSDYTGDRNTLQERLQQLKDFKGEMRQGQDMVNNATQLGERVCMSTAPRGQEAIHKEIQNLKDDWNTFSNSVNEMEGNLDRCIGNWMEMDDEYERFHQWMNQMENNVKDLHENKPDLQQKQKQLMQGEDIFEEILKKKLSLEHVKERSDAVSQRSIDPRVSNNMMMLTTKYQGLMSAAKGMLQRLNDNAKDHKSYDKAFDDAAHWLAEMDERVQDCNDTSGDWDTIQDRMNGIKQITASMDEGLQLVNNVCDLAEKILPNTSSDGKRIIEQQVTELTNEWEKLNQAISECSTMLEGVQERWNDYEEYYGSLVKWLADTEHTLQMEPEPKAQLVEKKTQLDKFKLVLSDVENHHRLVNELAERVANLEALSENPDVSDSLSDVQSRYDRVRNRAREIVAKLDRAYHDHLDFHEAQQDSEKWLLQTSFKLMSHNSLNVSSMEITQRQLDKHRALIRDIEDYRMTLDMVNKKGRHLAEDNCRVPKMASQIQSQLRNLEESYLNLQSTAEQIKNRLQDVLQKWQDYKDLLDNDMQFLTGEFTQWMADCDKDVPDNLQEAQRKLDNIKAMWERMSGMRQELTNAAHRCENLGGSMENLSEEEAQQESNVNQQAEKVEDKFKEANTELEKRMDSVRDTIHQWELVDRMRGDLRNWLHSKQEEFQEMEEKPAKLHAEAAEIEIANLQALREEVQAKGPAIDSFLNKYRDLTQHDPSLVDPVMRAVREDWEELLGQIENLLEDRENNLQASRELQEAQNTMDDDLENYVKELERIEKEDVAVQEKSLQLKTELFRKPCRSTQTPNSSARFGSRRNLLGLGGSDDSGDDDDGDDSVFKWPHSRHGTSRSQSRQSLNHSRQSLNHSRQSLNQSRHSQKRGPSSSHPRTFSPNPRSRSRNSRHNQSNDDLKKGAAAALESESEESGYGETYYTMHASSFDNVLENETIDTMRGTPLGLDMTRYSDNDSTVSYITGEFPQANPEDLRNTMTQTPGHARTQTEPDNDSPRTIHTQTSGLARNMSMQTSRMSIASQRSTGSRGSRADLLRSILMDVKEIKQQRGLNDSPGLSEDSMISNTSMKKNMLQTIQSDVQALKNEGRQGTAGTQTISEQGTQTGIKLFPEGDSARNSRHGRLRDLMDDVKNLKGGSPDSPNDLRSRQSSRTGTPYERRPVSSVQNRPSPVRFSTPGPATNGPVQNGVHEQNGYDYPQQPYMRSLPVPPNPQPQMNGYPQYPGRMVTQDDINAISDRIQRLSNYQLPPRRTLPQPPPPPQPPQYIVPVYTAPPRRVRINEFPQSYNDEDGFMSDESEYEGGHAPRRGRRRRNRLDHLDIEDALDEAVKQGRQLKNMSKKMKDSLREDLLDL